MERLTYYIKLTCIWLLFPAAWFLFYRMDDQTRSNTNETVFYTSVKAPKGAIVEFYKGKSFMVRLNGTGNSFKPLQYEGGIDKLDSLNIKVSGAHTGDTISFESINLFEQNTVYTLPENQFQLIKSDSAYICNTSAHLLSYIQNKNAGRFTISLTNPAFWAHPDVSNLKFWLLLSLFIFAFVILLILAPPINILLIATSFACVFMGFYWWIGKDITSEINITNSKPMKEVVIYHNSSPIFTYELHRFYKGPSTNFKSQVDLVSSPYTRISFINDTTSINVLSFKLNYGIFSKNWNLKDIPPSQMFTNDVDYDSRTSTWKVTGGDPFVSITTAPLIQEIDKLIFIRKSVFLFISIFVFIVSLFLFPLLSRISLDKKILVSSFFVVLFNSFLFWVFNSDKLELDSEKRLAYLPPALDNLTFPEYTHDLGLYLQDQLPGRTSLIVSNNFIKYETFGQVPGNAMVHFGLDRWMFYTGENTTEIYENKHPLTDSELNAMKTILVARRDWLRKRNIHYYIFFPRLPHFIYNEKMGPGLNVYNAKPKLIQLLNYLKQTTDLDIIDMEKPIQEAKGKYKQNIYYTNDSHWTDFGAYFAYRDIIKYIQRDFPNLRSPIPFDSIKWEEGYDYGGDLAQLLCLNTVIPRHIYIPVNSRVNDFYKIAPPIYPEFVSIHPMLFYNSYDEHAPKMIMNRDSYTNALIPYFSSEFSRQGYLWSPFFYPTIIEKEKPEIVMTEMSERCLYDLLLDTPPRDSISSSQHR